MDNNNSIYNNGSRLSTQEIYLRVSFIREKHDFTIKKSHTYVDNEIWYFCIKSIKFLMQMIW